MEISFLFRSYRSLQGKRFLWGLFCWCSVIFPTTHTRLKNNVAFVAISASLIIRELRSCVLWQYCGNLWQREEKCGKGCGNVAILLYICVNKKRLIILIIRHLTFLPQLPQMNCPKMGSLIFNCNFFPKNKDF